MDTRDTVMPESEPADKRADEIRTFLEGLGATADKVATSLAERGFKGRRLGFNDCPNANALKDRFPDATYISVNRYETYIDFGAESVNPRILTPAGVRDFITMFDDEAAYPELVAETAVTQS